MTTTLIDGKAAAERLRGQIALRVADAAPRIGRPPGLAVVIVGDDPASQVYVRNKTRFAAEAGFFSAERRLPADVAQSELLDEVVALNADTAIDGIIVQLPLPAHIDTSAVVAAIDPAKDVDGLHPLNVGRLASGLPGLVPCTPRGCMHLLRGLDRRLAGLHAVIAGRSILVGRPLAQLLLRADCTVTIAHSRTVDLAALCRTADILVAAVGRPKLLGADCVRRGASVIDVGINRVTGENGKAVLVGDVDFNAALGIAGAITPVPGGVGPMTVACLLENTLEAYERTTSKTAPN